MEFGTITGSEISTNKDSDQKTLLLQVVASDDDDVQTVELHASSGEDTQPPSGSRVFYMEVSDSFSVGIVVDDGAEPADDIEPGEKEIYSIDGGSRKAKIRWKKNGQLILNDGGGTAIEFARMKSAFDQLRADHDALVTTVNTLQLPVNLTTLLAGPPVAQSAPSSADMSSAESDTVNIP
jgi:phage gp45-like